MKTSRVFPLAVIVCAVLTTVAPAKPTVCPFESAAEPAAQGKIDELVFAKLKQLGITPARPCSDEAFLRRVYLDVLGTLPTAEEASQFLDDQDAGKRRKLVDRMLARDEFADYWSMKWCDLLRVKSEFPINLWPNAVQAYHHWIHICLKENMPYDRMVREMLTANGSNFRVPQVNFYRAVQSKEPQAVAQAVALSFMGVRPEGWPAERWAGMTPFFSLLSYKETSEWKEEIVALDLQKAMTEATRKTLQAAVFPDGTPAHLRPGDDPRKAFANWLITPSNPWFTRNIANRLWSWLLGRGIIHEPDDIRPDNPPSNPELLTYLEHQLIAAHYDLKELYRPILNSQTYQLSWIARSGDPKAAANFASYPLRRLEAEVLVDALCQITGTTEEYSSPIPEPFTFIPEDQRSIALADASITSPFLEKFGRSSRDTGLEAERNNRPTAAQRLDMLNSSHIRAKLDQGPKMQALLRSKGSSRETIDQIYLTILSRRATDDEAKTVETFLRQGGANDPVVEQPRRGTKTPRGKDRKPSPASFGGKSRGALSDVVWALVNSAEFIHRH